MSNKTNISKETPGHIRALRAMNIVMDTAPSPGIKSTTHPIGFPTRPNVAVDDQTDKADFMG